MKGFTLIEILVSVAIFTVVMTIALGALLSVSVADRKAEALKSVVNNLDFALDSMSRAIRTGYNYNCNSSAGGNCTMGGSAIYFTPANGGVQWAYRLEDTNTDANAGLVCGQSGIIGCIARASAADGFNSWSSLTSPEVIVCGSTTGGSCPSGSTDRLFYLIGAPQGSADNVQPKVTLSINGYVQVTVVQQSAFHIQTTVTQRLYDQ